MAEAWACLEPQRRGAVLTTKAACPALRPRLSTQTRRDAVSGHQEQESPDPHLENGAQEGILLVPADSDEDQEGQHPD